MHQQTKKLLQMESAELVIISVHNMYLSTYPSVYLYMYTYICTYICILVYVYNVYFL